MGSSESRGLQIDREPAGVTSSGWAADPTPSPNTPPPGPFIPGHPVHPSTDAETEPDVECFRQKHLVPAVILVAAVLGSMAFAAFGAPSGATAGAVLAAAIGVIVSLGFGTLIFTAVGWIVGRLFGADYGTIPVMLLRFGAVAAGYNLAGAVLAQTMGPFAMFFLLPVLLILAVWLTAMDFIQSLAFAFVMTVVTISLGLILAGTAAAALL